MKSIPPHTHTPPVDLVPPAADLPFLPPLSTLEPDAASGLWEALEIPESGNTSCLRIYTLYHTWELMLASDKFLGTYVVQATSLPYKFLTSGNCRQNSCQNSGPLPSPSLGQPACRVLSPSPPPSLQLALSQASFISCSPGPKTQTCIRAGESISGNSSAGLPLPPP